MFASFYTTKTAETHGTEYCAYYLGRNHCANRDKPLKRGAFKSAGDWDSYKRGFKHVTAEDRLDNDTSWDD